MRWNGRGTSFPTAGNVKLVRVDFIENTLQSACNNVPWQLMATSRNGELPENRNIRYGVVLRKQHVVVSLSKQQFIYAKTERYHLRSTGIFQTRTLRSDTFQWQVCSSYLQMQRSIKLNCDLRVFGSHHEFIFGFHRFLFNSCTSTSE